MKNDYYFEKAAQGNGYTDEVPEYAIEIPRSDQFISAAQELSDFINQLSLSREQNDRLIALMVAQVLAAEEGGFRYGLEIGVEYG